eukprot:GHVS01028800.1.p1 GENE.GHVS01028800.1~~GHVS01028800.1.p1  ORF type:complete len:160 (+),score=24.63 GHVS01028800.1:182-661(+)
MAGASGEGAYMKFDPASQGTLLLLWSKTPVEDALASMNPSKKVPPFKYTTNGGKSEIVRNIQTDHKKYYSGWCSFIKLCKQFDGELLILDTPGPKDVKVILNKNDNTVVMVEINKKVNLSNVGAVACVPKDAQEFNCQTMTQQLFLEKASEKGGGMPVA